MEIRKNSKQYKLIISKAIDAFTYVYGWPGYSCTKKGIGVNSPEFMRAALSRRLRIVDAESGRYALAFEDMGGNDASVYFDSIEFAAIPSYLEREKISKAIKAIPATERRQDVRL